MTTYICIVFLSYIFVRMDIIINSLNLSRLSPSFFLCELWSNRGSIIMHSYIGVYIYIYIRCVFFPGVFVCDIVYGAIVSQNL